MLPVDGAHAASCEEMATAMSSAETAAYKGLQQCIETVMAEVNSEYNIIYVVHVQSSKELGTNPYQLPDDGISYFAGRTIAFS